MRTADKASHNPNPDARPSSLMGSGGFTREMIDFVVARFADELNPEKIILFGSAATGDPARARDLDLLVVMETDVPVFERRGIVVDLLWDWGIDVDIKIYTPEEFKYCVEVEDTFIEEVLKTGRVVFDKKAA